MKRGFLFIVEKLNKMKVMALLQLSAGCKFVARPRQEIFHWATFHYFRCRFPGFNLPTFQFTSVCSRMRCDKVHCFGSGLHMSHVCEYEFKINY